MSEPPAEGTEEKLRWLEAEAEKSYSALYDAPFGTQAAACYSNAKEYLYDAIALARRLSRDSDAERLARRLDHIKAVFRSQFS